MNIKNNYEKFISRMEIPDNKMLSIVFFLTEQKEYEDSSIEAKIVSYTQRGGYYIYSLEFSYSMKEYITIRTIKNMI